jgi:hypothetical protein
MHESNPPVFAGCGDEGLQPCSGRASGSLAPTGRYWYIDNKRTHLEEMFRRVSYRWFLHRAFRVFYDADRSAD